MFYSIQRNIATRIKINFNQDVRRPLTFFFFLLLAAGSFLLASPLLGLFQQNAATIAQQVIPETVQIDATKVISTKISPSEFVRSQAGEILQNCNGDQFCEAAILNEAHVQAEKMLSNVPLLQSIDTRSEKPFAELIAEGLGEELQNGQTIQRIREQTGIPPELIVGFLVFTIATPFSFVLSLVAGLLISIVYFALRIIGFFQVDHETVQKEVIR
jgi:hypothetical protein